MFAPTLGVSPTPRQNRRVRPPFVVCFSGLPLTSLYSRVLRERFGVLIRVR